MRTIPLLLAIASSSTAFSTGAQTLSAAESRSASLGVRIVIPPHCFELMPHASENGALAELLAQKRLLCKERTGLGRERHIGQQEGTLRLLDLPVNAWHRAGE